MHVFSFDEMLSNRSKPQIFRTSDDVNTYLFSGRRKAHKQKTCICKIHGIFPLWLLFPLLSLMTTQVGGKRLCVAAKVHHQVVWVGHSVCWRKAGSIFSCLKFLGCLPLKILSQLLGMDIGCMRIDGGLCVWGVDGECVCEHLAFFCITL